MSGPPYATSPTSVRRSPVDRVRSTMHPAGYHGHGKDRGYFEGWYVKLVGADRGARLAVIPGVFLGTDGQAHEAFVQVLDGRTGATWYQPYDVAEFRADAHRFEVSVGPNTFSTAGVHLDVPAAGLRGDVRFTSAFDPWPVTLASPGVMGWYAWMPFMECYHGVVSFGHDLAGRLTLGDDVLDLERGRGYLEKDWGQAFPAGYVWMQSNHFDTRTDACLVASTALIPWVRREFRGMIVGLRIGPDLHRFATYTGARTLDLRIDDEHVTWTMASRTGNRLRLRAERRRGGLLHAPIRTEMHRRVEETLDARIDVLLIDRRGRVLFEDTGHCAGLEVHGDIERLLATR